MLWSEVAVRRGWVGLAGWIGASVIAAAALSLRSTGSHLPEPAHWVGHAVLFGLPPAWLAHRGHSPAVAVGVGVASGLAVEVAQMLAAGRWLGAEATFDLGLDAVVAMAGALLTGGAPVAHAIGAWLHPGVTLGITALLLLAPDPWARLPAGVTAGLALVPAVADWVTGVRSGRYANVDLTDRAQRARPFGLAVVALPVVAGAGWWVQALPVGLAVALVIAGATLTAVTALGAKPSGHVASAALAAVVLAGPAPRWAGLALFAAGVLAFARVRAGVHTRTEVGLGAAIASLGAAVAAWLP